MRAALLFGLLVSLAFASSSSSWTWTSSSSSSSSSFEECSLSPSAGDVWTTTDGDLTWINDETIVFQWKDGSNGVLIATLRENADGTFTFQEIADGPAADSCTTANIGIYNIIFPLEVAGDCNTFSLDTVSDQCASRGSGFDGVTFTAQGTEGTEMCAIPENRIFTGVESATPFVATDYIFLEDGYVVYEYQGGLYYSRIVANNGDSITFNDIASSDAAVCTDNGEYTIEWNRDCTAFRLTLEEDPCTGRDVALGGTTFTEMDSEMTTTSDDSDSMTTTSDDDFDSSDDSDSSSSSSSWNGKHGKAKKSKSSKHGKKGKSSKSSKSGKGKGKNGSSSSDSTSSDSLTSDWSWTSDSDSTSDDWVSSTSKSSSSSKSSSDRVAVVANKVAGSASAPTTSAKWVAIPVTFVGLFAGLAVAAAVVYKRRNNQYIAL